MKKWFVGVILFVFVMTLGSYVFVDYELKRMFGGHTQIAAFDLPDDGPDRYALTGVNILSPDGDEFVPDRAIIIDNGKIELVDSNENMPANIRKIDGGDMFLVPGYTDSHVHLWESENDLLLYLANGVTQVREMNGSDKNLRWKKEVEQGRIGPDIFVVAPQLANFELPGGYFTAWFQRKTNVHSPEDIDAALQTFKEKGYDAVKTSSYLDEQGYHYVTKVAGDYGLPVVGHLPVAITLDDVWQSDRSEITHVEELVKALDREFGGYDDKNAEEFLEFVRGRSEDVARRLAEKNISITSTLWLIDSFPKQKANLDEVLTDAELAYANPGITEGTVITSHGMGWLPGVNIYRWPEEWGEEKRARSTIYWEAYAKAQHIIFEALLEKDIPIMAGTDANVPAAVPGFSLHDEMQSLYDAGMAPAKVLAAATTAPAKWAGTNSGRISPGYKADLVLLRGNPLKDIGQTKSIEMVIKAGRMFTRADLDEMLKAVKTANDNSRTIDLSEY